MTPQALARLYAAAFADTRAWTAEEFSTLLDSPHVFSCVEQDGFAIGRVVADEAELLTIAVHPDARRDGLGHRLLTAFEDSARTRGATCAFLEVAEDNTAAMGLYSKAGYVVSGRRPDYYAKSDGTRVSACLMDKDLT